MTDHLRPHDAALERLRRLHPVLIDLSLGRVERLLAALGAPQDRLPPIVHVAGTNGKGSTVAFLRAIAEAAGLKVHVFTSPHLVRFAERIRVAGELISEDRLTELLGRVEAVNANQPITFFEITAAAALTAFAEAPADLCLVEVGLGGRFDATNVFGRPAVTVITPIDYDHKEYLGDTLAAIAGEKAGILRRGAPAVVARQPEEAMTVIEATAAQLHAPLTVAGRDFDAYAEAGRLIYQDEAGLLDLPPPALVGRHQYDNAGVAIAAARTLNKRRIDEAAIARGVAAAVWPARMQRLTAGPLARMAAVRGADLWLDGGHNPHAAVALAQTAADLSARDGRPVVFVMGLLARKDVAGIFAALAATQSRLITVDFQSDLAADAQALANQAQAQGLAAQACPDVTAGVRLALSEAGPSPHVIICGSLYLAGEVLALSPETLPR
jgi:dihydrofolate synthase/folylpolyglutamate synthase